MQAGWFSFPVIGLVCDIIGAMLLANALIFTPRRKMIALPEMNILSDGAKILAERRIDAIGGLSYLVLGFSLQAIPYFASDVDKVYCWAVTILVAAGLISFCSARARLIRYEASKLNELSATESAARKK